MRVGQAVGRLAFVGIAIAMLGGVSTMARAMPALGPPAGWPDLAGAAISPTNLPAGARVTHQGYVKPDSSAFAEYDREFAELSVKINGKKLIAVEDDVSLGRSTASADTLITALPLGLLLEAPQLGKEFQKTSGIKVTYTKVGKPSSLGAGDDSVGMLVRIGTKAGEIRAVFAAVRVGQVDSLFYFVGMPRTKLGLAEAKVVGRLSVSQIKAAMAPHDTALPTISGTAAIGQTISGANGTWLSFPTAYAYQWQRCDATGANCAGVPGSTTQSYVIASTDAGSTFRLVVGAQNRFGSGSATSAPTSVVAAPAGPTGPTGP